MLEKIFDFIGEVTENISNYYYERKYGSTLIKSNLSNSEFKAFQKESKELARYARNRTFGGFWSNP